MQILPAFIDMQDDYPSTCAYPSVAHWLCEWDGGRLEREGGGPWPARGEEEGIQDQGVDMVFWVFMDGRRRCYCPQIYCSWGRRCIDLQARIQQGKELEKGGRRRLKEVGTRVCFPLFCAIISFFYLKRQTHYLPKFVLQVTPQHHRTVTELFAEDGLLLASLLFRSDSKRNTTTPLVANTAYCATCIIPGAREPIDRALEAGPLILSYSIETQFKKLLLEPLRFLVDLGPRSFFAPAISPIGYHRRSR